MFTADGWYRTGDLGRLDDDGYLWSTAALDDMFKVKGATVYPSEVEAALRSIPRRRARRTSPTCADDDGPPEVGALVVTDAPVERGRRRRAGAAERVQGADPLAACTADPADVPMTATGKVDKAALQRLLHDDGTAAAG